MKIEKEGLPGDITPALGAGDLRFKSGRPDHLFTELAHFLFCDISATLQLGNIWEQLLFEQAYSVSLRIPTGMCIDFQSRRHM